MSTTDTYCCTRAIVTTTPLPRSIECKFGPLGSTCIHTIYFVQLGEGQLTYGANNKHSNLATVFLSYVEWQALADAVALVNLFKPVYLRVTYVDRADPQYADVTSVLPVHAAATEAMLQAVQEDVSVVKHVLTHQVAVQVHEVLEIARELVKRGGSPPPPSPGPFDAAGSFERPSEPPAADSDPPPAYPNPASLDGHASHGH
jgi:hypothetical protein